MGRRAASVFLASLGACFYDVPPLAGTGDAGTEASAPDVVEAGSDVFVLPDAVGPVDGLAAIRFGGGCGALSSQASLPLSFSNEDFTIAFWLRLEQKPQGQAALVWRGGRTAGEPGWSVGLKDNALQFCTSDSNGAQCGGSWNVPLNHRVHVGVAAKWGDQMPRTVTVFARDLDGAMQNHMQVSSGNGVNNWTSAVPFVVGGAQGVIGCADGAPVTIDEIRIYKAVLTANQLDQVAMARGSCALAVAGWHFDEGQGAMAASCTDGGSLSLSGNYVWVPTPFP